tara:strand:+ start:2271 stop:3131 length:861 start_codon:yes stop_codon:yes gene_type:complete
MMEIEHSHIKLKVPKSFKKVQGFKNNNLPEDQQILLQDDMSRDCAGTTTAADPNATCFHRIFTCLSYYRPNSQERRKDATANSVSVCESMIDKLDVKIQSTETRLNVVQSLLKKNVKAKNRKMAKHYLIQRNRLTKSVDSYRRYKQEMEAMTISLNETDDQQDFISSFKEAQTVLKKHSKALPLEQFESLTDDFDEAQQELGEFHEVLQQRDEMKFGNLDDELDALMNDGRPPVDPPNNDDLILINSLPKVPTGGLHVIEEEGPDDIPIELSSAERELVLSMKLTE